MARWRCAAELRRRVVDLVEGPKLVAGMLRMLLPGFDPGEPHALSCMVSYTPTGNPDIDRTDERVA